MSVDVHSSGRLASASADRTVRIWKLVVSAEGVPHVRFLSNLAVHENAVNMVRFSPNGQFLASCSDGTSRWCASSPVSASLAHSPAPLSHRRCDLHFAQGDGRGRVERGSAAQAVWCEFW